MTPSKRSPRRANAEGSLEMSGGANVPQCTPGSGLARLVGALERAGCSTSSRGLARCPAHDDRHPSLNFKQGTRGALVVCRTQGCSTASIAEALGLTVPEFFDDWTPSGSRPRPTLRLAPPEPEPEPEPLLEIPEHEVWRPGERVVYVRSDGSTRDAIAAAVHVYRRAEGRAHHVVVRIEPPPPARKWFLPLRWDGRVWQSGAQPRPASIYRLELLAVPGLRQVVVVEGEKAADALNACDIPGLLAVTWPGGSSAVDRADWTPLAGRNVVLWPDADEPGVAAMRKLAAILSPDAASLKWVRSDHLPRGHDAADLDPDTPMVDFLRGRIAGVER